MDYLDRVCADGGYEDEFDDIALIEGRLELLNNLTYKQQRKRHDNALIFRYYELQDELEALDYPGKTWNEIQLIKHYESLRRGE